MLSGGIRNVHGGGGGLATRITFDQFRPVVAGRVDSHVAAERLCGALFVGLTTLKGYFYINLGGTLR
jgi:hypothetical protein